MRFGLALTTSVNPEATPAGQADYALQIAALAEALGFDSVWVSDRTVIPADLAARYPELFGPGRLAAAAQNLLDALTVLSVVAGRTQSLRLGTSVLVLPLRHPVVTAKMVTTLDVLSGGRAILGVGTGWMPEEFQVQQPHPPIWVGGNTAAAFRRAARLGDGWHGLNLTPGEAARSAADLRGWCDRLGRDPAEVAVSLRGTVALGQERRIAGGKRAPLSGSAGQVLDDLRRYRAAGLATLVFSVAAPDTAATLEAIRRLADITVRV